MTVDQEDSEAIEEEKKKKTRKNVLVGIRMNGDSRDLLNWSIVKVADPGDCVIVIYVCQSSGAFFFSFSFFNPQPSILVILHRMVTLWCIVLECDFSLLPNRPCIKR